MKPTHPVELLCCALATEEGWFVPNSQPRLKNNPGDLRFANQKGAATPPPTSGVQPIATFDTPQAGITALFRQVWLMVADGLTVREIIEKWAPPNENNTGAYLANVLAWTGLQPEVRVRDILPPLAQLNRSA